MNPKVTRREIAVSLFKPNVNSGVGDGSVMMIISPVQIPYECADIWMLVDAVLLRCLWKAFGFSFRNLHTLSASKEIQKEDRRRLTTDRPVCVPKVEGGRPEGFVFMSSLYRLFYYVGRLNKYIHTKLIMI